MSDELNRRKQDAEQLMEFWKLMLPGEPLPDTYQFFVWVALHPVGRVADAISKVARKVRSTPAMSLDHRVRFCSSVANRQKTDDEKKIVATDVSVAP